MELAMANVGESIVIEDFRGEEDIKRHLYDLGFVKGETVKVVGENASGMILMIKGVKLALNRGLASKIVVSSICESKKCRENIEYDYKRRDENDVKRFETGRARHGGFHFRKRSYET